MIKAYFNGPHDHEEEWVERPVDVQELDGAAGARDRAGGAAR
jgi:hypothetical protein